MLKFRIRSKRYHILGRPNCMNCSSDCSLRVFMHSLVGIFTNFYFLFILFFNLLPFPSLHEIWIHQNWKTKNGNSRKRMQTKKRGKTSKFAFSRLSRLLIPANVNIYSRTPLGKTTTTTATTSGNSLTFPLTGSGDGKNSSLFFPRTGMKWNGMLIDNIRLQFSARETRGKWPFFIMDFLSAPGSMHSSGTDHCEWHLCPGPGHL